jgi:hypothetical protein
MKKYMLFMAVGVLFLSILACGSEDISSTTEDPSAGSTSISILKIINKTQNITFCYLYTASAGSSNWGEDLLQGNQIEPGNDYSLEMEAAVLDLKIEDCSHENSAINTGQDFSTNSVEWSLEQEQASAPSEITLTLKNENPNISICYLYLRMSDNDAWGDDWLKGARVDSGTSYSVTIDNPGIYTGKIIDCNKTGEAFNDALDLTQPAVWTIK